MNLHRVFLANINKFSGFFMYRVIFLIDENKIRSTKYNFSNHNNLGVIISNSKGEWYNYP